jgi:hypothetical protein
MELKYLGRHPAHAGVETGRVETGRAKANTSTCPERRIHLRVVLLVATDRSGSAGAASF